MNDSTMNIHNMAANPKIITLNGFLTSVEITTISPSNHIPPSNTNIKTMLRKEESNANRTEEKTSEIWLVQIH